MLTDYQTKDEKKIKKSPRRNEENVAAEGKENRNGPINSRISWNRDPPEADKYPWNRGKMYHMRVQADTFNYPPKLKTMS